MKKPESSEERYRIRHNQEILGDNLTTEEYCDMMEDIAQKYYEGKFPNPLSLTTEICNWWLRNGTWVELSSQNPKKQDKEEVSIQNTPLPLVIKLKKGIEGRESELLALRNWVDLGWRSWYGRCKWWRWVGIWLFLQFFLSEMSFIRWSIPL